MKRNLRAFTLIELLIVVAIIAILAAIAVPNFLESQVRAKVSRTKSDMRTIATALESYMVDHNHYPPDYADDVPVPYYLNKAITTPIAYLTNGARMQDIFADKVQESVSGYNPNQFRERFRYRAFQERYLSDSQNNPWGFNLPGPDAAGMIKATEVHGAWFMASKGPDGSTLPLPSGFADGNSQDDWLWLLYDPTNGTISDGDIIRSQALGDANAVGYGEDVNY